MRRHGLIILALTAAFVFAGTLHCAPAAAQPAPRRIVSINLCTDIVLLDLVAPDRIAALSHLAADPRVSPVADVAARLPSTHGAAEAVLALDPDLVIAGTYSTPATVALLERLDRRVLKVPLASDLAAIRRLVRQIAASVGEVARGEAVIARFDRRIADAARGLPADARRPTALVYQINGLTSGPGSLADPVLAAAGFDNLATHLRLGAGGQVALETLVVAPPDLLVLTDPAETYRTAVAANLTHPALAAATHDHARLVVPWRHWLCGTPHVATAIEALAAARVALPGARTLGAARP